jgi:hypothetical protein
MADDLDALLADALAEHQAAADTIDPDDVALYGEMVAAGHDPLDVAAGLRLADMTVGRFEADLADQLPLLERQLGRPLLTHEVEGIRDRGLHTMHTRGETLQAGRAHFEYYEHEGLEMPDMSKPEEVDRFMANRLREGRRLAEQAEADPEPPPEGAVPRPEYVAETRDDPAAAEQNDRAQAKYLRASRAAAEAGAA